MDSKGNNAIPHPENHSASTPPLGLRPLPLRSPIGPLHPLDSLPPPRARRTYPVRIQRLDEYSHGSDAQRGLRGIGTVAGELDMVGTDWVWAFAGHFERAAKRYLVGC